MCRAGNSRYRAILHRPHVRSIGAACGAPGTRLSPLGLPAGEGAARAGCAGMESAVDVSISSPPAPPPQRRCLPLCRRLFRLPPPVVRRLAIRIGPEIIRTRQTRIVGRVASGRDECDRFTPSRATQSREIPRSSARAIYPDYTRTEAMLLDRAAAEAKRDLAEARSRLAEARADYAALETGVSGMGADDGPPMSYAIERLPDAHGSVVRPPHLVHVPGIVRAYVSPAGRLIDVLM